MTDIVLKMIPVKKMLNGFYLVIFGAWKEMDATFVNNIKYLDAQEKAQKIMERTQDPVPDKRFFHPVDRVNNGLVPGLEAPTVWTI